MALKCNTPCDADGVCPYGASFDGNVDCEFFCGENEPQDNPAIWDDAEDISENSTTEYGDEPTTEYSENSKEGKTMTINLTICGATVPVEISEEELNKNGYFKNSPMNNLEDAWADGKRQLADAFFCKLVERMDITERQSELLSDTREWWDYYRGEVTTIEDEEDFAERVLSGDLLKEMTAKAEELAPKEAYYEFEVELSRTIKQKQTVTITIKAEDEEDARSKMCDLDMSTLYDHDVVNSYDWEDDDWGYEDDEEIEDWSFNGESDEDGENLIEL